MLLMHMCGVAHCLYNCNVICVIAGGSGGGAVYVSVGGVESGSSTSDTSVTLADCVMANNTAAGL